MTSQPAMNPRRRRKLAAFTLIEVCVAIGIFAFVLVGILGLFPVALKQRKEAEFQDRTVLIARQMFEAADGASVPTNVVSFLTNVSLRTTEYEGGANNVSVTNISGITNTNTPLVFGYKIDGSAPSYPFGLSASAWSEADVQGQTNLTAKSSTSAQIIANTNTDDLCRIGLMQVTVGYPADLPADKRKQWDFSKLIYLK